MLKELVQESPAAATKLQEIDALMQRLGYQTFSEIAWKSGSGLGTEPWSTQISMLLADVIVLSVLENSGVRPEVVAGHSYGEFPALVAAGSLTLEQAIRATRARADLVKSSPEAVAGSWRRALRGKLRSVSWMPPECLCMSRFRMRRIRPYWEARRAILTALSMG
jgi:[acyl-carrier-protein] S-malonyltransferase